MRDEKLAVQVTGLTKSYQHIGGGIRLLVRIRQPEADRLATQRVHTGQHTPDLAMQDFIEVHLDEEITLTILSEVSLFSPWHSYRLFKDCVGLTPAEYIRRMRLSRSAMRLKRSNPSGMSPA